ncbi:hypothetical protein Tco_1387846 [Tanacetum coccineum]
MHTFKKALIIHQQYEELMEVRMVPHLEDPSRTNHVNIHGQWRLLADACGFPYTKLIRFKYVSDGEYLDVRAGKLEFVMPFLVKNLPQPWQTLFIVLIRCTTSRLTAFDQSKINTLQMFYVVVNQLNVDYAQLIWTDFLYQVEKKPQRAVQYP